MDSFSLIDSLKWKTVSCGTFLNRFIHQIIYFIVVETSEQDMTEQEIGEVEQHEQQQHDQQQHQLHQQQEEAQTSTNNS